MYEGSADPDSTYDTSSETPIVGNHHTEPIYATPMKKSKISNGYVPESTGSHPMGEDEEIQMNNISVFYADPFDNKGTNFAPDRDSNANFYESVFGEPVPNADVIDATATDESKFITTIVLDWMFAVLKSITSIFMRTKAHYCLLEKWHLRLAGCEMWFTCYPPNSILFFYVVR